MADTAGELRDPWLIAAWPGMGSVALAAGGYLVEELGAKLVHTVPPGHYFELKHVDVCEGMAKAGRMPRSLFFDWEDPGGHRDLLVFVGEAQPTSGGLPFCHSLLDYAMHRGIKRVMTFAAMATQLHPSNRPRVFGVSTDADLLAEMIEVDVDVLAEGQISGLNGVLLAAAAERSIPAGCLLGELPFFAVGLPNPRASHAVLARFARLAGVEIDLARIADQARQVEPSLLELLDKMKKAAQQQPEGELELPEFMDEADETDETDDADETQDDTTPADTLDPAARRHIESLFKRARRDRSEAMRLKEELDRLEVFEQYEDRFLDLFNRGE